MIDAFLKGLLAAIVAGSFMNPEHAGEWAAKAVAGYRAEMAKGGAK